MRLFCKSAALFPVTLRQVTTTSSAYKARMERVAARLARGPLPPMNTVIESPNDIEKSLPPDIEEAHRSAVAAGEETYIDPHTGLTVFTRVAHINKGRCCGCRCRHCPYGHVNVPLSKREVAATATNVVASVPSCAIPEMSSRLRVYTKTGDGGSTSLFSGERRSKSDLVFDALGTLDELNSNLGLARAHLRVSENIEAKVKQSLMTSVEDIQRRLFHIGALVATPTQRGSGGEATAPLPHNPDEWTLEMELAINTLDDQLPALTCFILAGDDVASSQLHVCRSVCRRAERLVVLLLHRDASEYACSRVPEAAKYLNRLSDFLFVAARAASDISKEVKWDKHTS